MSPAASPASPGGEAGAPREHAGAAPSRDARASTPSMLLPSGAPGGAEAPLASRLTWLIALRLAVLTVFLVVTAAVYLGGFTPGRFSSIVALVTVAAAYGVSGIYAVFLRMNRALRAIARAQLVTDQITWTALVYITGGASSGATSLYGLTCLTGAILLGLPGAIVAAASGAAAYLVLCAALGLHLLGVPPDQPAGAYATQWGELRYPMFVNLLALLVVTLLASYLAERLRATGGRLVQATARAEQATARAEQAERLAALGRLAAGLAHEIRNPLGSIAGSIELLRTGGTLSDEDRKLCEIIERETARLNDLVGDMLDLSRPRVPTLEGVDLSATARDVVVLAGRSGRGSDVEVRFDGPPSAPVTADAAQMRQVVWNLVRNAIQASSAGAVVTVRLWRDPSAWLLEIRDQGRGIPAGARDRLFDAFFTTRTHGMGIGLAVVKRILDDHGFAIEVDSREGEGTAFRVRVPDRPPESGGAERLAVAAELPPRSRPAA
ncbi:MULTISPECIES: sensor histidine kinase [Sorangium]|uniref:histidine kinase n=1 Tax=Sorangium cellulosum (strain So ce56) TaxID=448385 RepID=A9GH60_SORC5|nr:ATP-binding protein [Sorangium cellulosum]CAN96416.1 sensor histidine kinase [Sorangium cellulosum So ce56]